jgi:dTDP-glucose 4,6-dehydratase
MFRTVVAGGAGFLGSHLCERLLDEGHQVVCLDNLITGTAENIRSLSSHPRFTFVVADLTEPLSIDGPVDNVLNFASPASPVDYLRLPIETMKVGSIGTLHALSLASDKQARFVMASTSETYGDPQVHPQREDYWGHVNPVGPRGVYDEAKRFAEALTMAYRNRHGVDTGIVRIFNTFGPRMRPNDGRVIPTFISQALSDEPITVAGDGSQTRSLVYVDDLVEGIVRFMRSGHPGPMNIGSPREITVLDLALRVKSLVGSNSMLEFVPRAQDDPTLRRPDIALASSILGWEPRVALEDGLLRTIEWFRSSLDTNVRPDLMAQSA